MKKFKEYLSEDRWSEMDDYQEYGILYKEKPSQTTFRKASLTKSTHSPINSKHDKEMIKAITKDAEALKKQEGWSEYKITRNGKEL